MVMKQTTHPSLSFALLHKFESLLEFITPFAPDVVKVNLYHGVLPNGCHLQILKDADGFSLVFSSASLGLTDDLSIRLSDFLTEDDLTRLFAVAQMHIGFELEGSSQAFPAYLSYGDGDVKYLEHPCAEVICKREIGG